MPELPEVETILRALAPALTGRRIERVELFSPKMRTPLAPLREELPGRTILAVRRRARYIVAKLDNGHGLVMHFGMTGVVRVESPEVPRRKHEHVFLYLDNGLVFRFECARRFSVLEVQPLNANDDPPVFLSFGPEPLEDGFSPDYLYTRSRGVKQAVKPFLMDNGVVTGIGNIYATETLFAARVSPLKQASRLTRPACRRIVENARRVLQEAIRQGGTTIADFRHVDGTEGQFAVNLQIYGKAGCPCPVCGNLLKAAKQGGRTTVYCPHCQR